MFDITNINSEKDFFVGIKLYFIVSNLRRNIIGVMHVICSRSIK